MAIYGKRIYDASTMQDGKRILVDRLWPRGIKKIDAHIDLWAKELTPSNELRKWYHEDIVKNWDEFQRKYKEELLGVEEQLNELRQTAQTENITLLSAVKNLERSHVSILLDVLNTATLKK